MKVHWQVHRVKLKFQGHSVSLSDNQPGLAGGPLSQAPSQAQSSDSDSRHSVMEILGNLKESRPPPGNTSCKAASRCWSGIAVHGNRVERYGFLTRDRLFLAAQKAVQASAHLPYFGATGTEFSNHSFDMRIQLERSADSM